MPKVEIGIMAGSKNSSMRRSQRRINKLLDKNISQYEIPNPYKNCKANSYLPKNLTKQLSKMNFFSIRTLQNLHFSQPNIREEVYELLSKMRVAVQKQSEDLTTYIALMSKKSKKNSQKTIDEREDKNLDQGDIDELNDSVFMPRNSENSIQLNCLNEPYENLPLVSHQSEGVSMMSDNYEVDKLIFSTNQHLFRQMEQQFQLYEA